MSSDKHGVSTTLEKIQAINEGMIRAACEGDSETWRRLHEEYVRIKAAPSGQSPMKFVAKSSTSDECVTNNT